MIQEKKVFKTIFGGGKFYNLFLLREKPLAFILGYFLQGRQQ